MTPWLGTIWGEDISAALALARRAITSPRRIFLADAGGVLGAGGGGGAGIRTFWDITIGGCCCFTEICGGFLTQLPNLPSGAGEGGGGRFRLLLLIFLLTTKTVATLELTPAFLLG